ncbi:(Fe-S)-binding protein [Paenibacillaceae sp. P-4]|uniref:(Fe-S)-binding protein n=1 Tax=Paenibacillus TaxID=44249 RepID=UPI00038672D9|nr:MULTISPECIES: (Fe-S)-binding protein [Paenibacillus]EPY10097.1 hypothetical protein PAAL66ix_23165 [Paenibacillus alvei A6-6i-x]SDF00501.1 glycolate oxidase iron-sulfur subunit [Paenibacillus sp. cl6col]
MSQQQLEKTNNPLQKELVKTLDYEQLMNCMRCGFCQPTCPTYQETGLEAASPRGRIALMKAVADGIMEPDESFQKQMNLCLGCRACEPVCPSDVKYGQLLEQTKEAMHAHNKPPVAVKGLNRIARPVFMKHNRLLRMSKLLQTYQRSGLQGFARKKNLLRWLPPQMQMMERILPEADSQGVVKRAGGRHFLAKGEKLGTVGLFRGCIMDVLFTETNVNTIRLLTESGYDVIIPESQGCCGALFAHGGSDTATARDLAKQNIEAFRDAGVDYIASNAGGCGALLVEYDHLLKEESEWVEPAKKFAKQVKDISDLLMRSQRWSNLPVMPQGNCGTAESSEPSETVTYQDSCHLRNVMRASSGPRQLIRRIPGIRYKELEGADVCCGSAGIYNIVQPDMANSIVDRKMDAVRETQASIILTSNPGCLMQMKVGVERDGVAEQVKVMHVVDYFAEKMLK